VGFKTKPEIALDEIRAGLAAGLPRGVVLLDAGYGTHGDLRNAIAGLDLTYVAGILSNTTVWPPGMGPLPPKPSTPGRGQPTKRLRRDGAHQPVTVKDLAFSLDAKAWRTITWREGTNVPLRSRFARLRVRIAHRDFTRSEPWPQQWLMIEWPKGEQEPTKYWLSSLPESIGFARMVDLAKLRWRIERDYHDLKQELGLGHFEGRGWRGFHHHATLCIAAYGFLICERQTIPPSGMPRPARFQASRLPQDYRPRGSPAQTRASCPQLDRHHAAATDPSHHPPPVTMSMLRTTLQPNPQINQLMTQ
jgi:SRSO17 transposase